MRRTVHRTTVLLVAGMKSPLCRDRVVAALEAVPGVLDVSVSLFRARAVVTRTGSCRLTALLHAVASAGYSARLFSSPVLRQNRAAGRARRGSP